MKIDFNLIDQQTIANFRGGEKEMLAKMFIDGETKIMQNTLVSGASIGYHEHSDNCEIIYVLSGTATVKYNDEEYILNAGEAHFCKQGNLHSLLNDDKEDLVFFAVVI